MNLLILQILARSLRGEEGSGSRRGSDLELLLGLLLRSIEETRSMSGIVVVIGGAALGAANLLKPRLQTVLSCKAVGLLSSVHSTNTPIS